jgi:hypothetical protein
MALWQLDIVGGVHLADGGEVKIVSGIDDHSRFVVCARVVARATAVWVCEALELARSGLGCPRRSGPTTARSSPPGWVPAPARPALTASVLSRASSICSPRRGRRPPRARSSAGTRPCAVSS